MDEGHKSNSSLARAPFAEQLTQLTQMSLPDLSENKLHTNDKKSTLKHVSDATDQVLDYFSTGRSVLSGLDSHDDVEWMFEGKQSVSDVGKTIMRAGDIMNQLMTVLETTRDVEPSSESGESVCVSSKAQEEAELDEAYYPVVERIETAITEWHDILGLVRDLRSQIDIATEWKDFHDQILTEVQDEIDNCSAVIFEIEEKRHLVLPEDQQSDDSGSSTATGSGSITSNKKSTNLDVLTSVMDESPFLGHPKLPNMSDTEREMNQKLIEVSTRVKPLRASLDFIPLRLEQYSAKAKDLFPSSIQSLQAKYKHLHSRWEALNNEISVLEKELGEDRWLVIFRNTGVQAQDMLDSYEQNIKIIDEQQKHLYQNNSTSNNSRHHQIERCQTQNAYLAPAITRIVALFDRALKDRLTVNGEMYNTQAKLHKRWTRLEHQYHNQQQSFNISTMNSPLSSKEDHSSTCSNRSSASSASSPSSSLHSSPVISSSATSNVKPINFKLKAAGINTVGSSHYGHSRDRTSLENCVEINPLRGLGRPVSVSTGSATAAASAVVTHQRQWSSSGQQKLQEQSSDHQKDGTRKEDQFLKPELNSKRDGESTKSPQENSAKQDQQHPPTPETLSSSLPSSYAASTASTYSETNSGTSAYSTLASSPATSDTLASMLATPRASSAMMMPSRMSLLPVPKDSPRPMQHVKPPQIIPEAENIPDSRSSTPTSNMSSSDTNNPVRRQSMLPRPTSRLSRSSFGITTSGGTSKASYEYRRCSTSMALDTPRSITPRPRRSSSRLGGAQDTVSRLPRPSSRLSGSQTPTPRKVSMPMSATAGGHRRDSYASMMSTTPSRKSYRSSYRPGTAIGTYRNY